MSEFVNSLNPEQLAAFEAEMTRVREEESSKRPPSGRRTDACGNLNLKIGKAHAISFYGWGRFPVTTFAPNLLTILNHADALREYMVANKDSLSWGKGTEVGDEAPSDEEILGIADVSDDDETDED